MSGRRGPNRPDNPWTRTEIITPYSRTTVEIRQQPIRKALVRVATMTALIMVMLAGALICTASVLLSILCPITIIGLPVGFAIMMLSFELA